MILTDKILTNTFYVAVRLLSNRPRMTTKCGKNKEVAREPFGECVTDVCCALEIKHQHLINLISSNEKYFVLREMSVFYSVKRDLDRRSLLLNLSRCCMLYIQLQ